jgi:hypothetical protein
MILLEDYCLIMERRFVFPSGWESFTGGRVNSW